MNNKITIVNISWLVLTLMAATLVVCMLSSLSLEIDVGDRFIISIQLLVQALFYLASLAVVAWLAYLLHQQWTKERELSHIVKLELKAQQERVQLRNATVSPPPINKMELAQELLKLINTLKESKLLKKDELAEMQKHITDLLIQELQKEFIEVPEVGKQVNSHKTTDNKTQDNG